MNSVILCEGKTDAILISYYLLKVHGWKFNKRHKSFIKVPISEENNESADWYSLSDDNLLIWGVGGKDNFNNGIKELLQINILNDRPFENIIIVTDRDKVQEDSDITDVLKNEFLEIDSSFNLFNREWTSLNYTNSFGIKLKANTSCLIIPFDQSGALETFLLNCLSEDEDKKDIINLCQEFVSNMNSNKYVYNDRLKLKAQLGVTFAILSPEKVFTTLDSILKQVPWENYKTLQYGFSLFDALNQNQTNH